MPEAAALPAEFGAALLVKVSTGWAADAACVSCLTFDVGSGCGLALHLIVRNFSCAKVLGVELTRKSLSRKQPHPQQCRRRLLRRSGDIWNYRHRSEIMLKEDLTMKWTEHT